MTLASEKKALRVEARERRAGLAAACPDFGVRIASFAEQLPIPAGARVSGYIAMGEEADPAPLIAALLQQGREISYPRVHRGHPLTFHVPVAGEHMLRSGFGVLEPREDWPRVYPSVLLVPLLAFDAGGYRLGYGGGYYDRTLAELRERQPVTAIGVAFAGQEMERVPRDATDQPLDMVVTELGVRRFDPR
jgi:5-formyltetrahydrofolate cyclo-ligase